jgi:cytochrome b subunit of formate dehydrogenase
LVSRLAVTTLALVAASGASRALAQAPAGVAASDRSCLECHGQAHLGTLRLADRLPMVTGPRPPAGTEDAPRPGLVVGADALSGTVHAQVSCIGCHQDASALPHARELAPVSCTPCHAQAARDFALSVHAAAVAAGDPQAPRCQTCHTPHEILPKTDRRSSVHPLNVIAICGDCHSQHTAPTSHGADPGAIVTDYLDSVHGRAVTGAGLPVSATCADCHEHHSVRAAGDPEAATARERIPETCGRCHVGVVETYEGSVHGRALAAGSASAPVCTDCHAGHRISRAGTPEHHLDIVNECGDCHDRPELSGDRPRSFYRTYRQSYHGQVTELGSARAARCSDCHGHHDIASLADPASRVAGENLVETCRACHPGAGANFVRFDPHADYRDQARYPVLFAVWMYFVVMMSLAFGFFGIHSLLWLMRSLIERRRHGAPRHAPATHEIRRFSKINRVNHFVVIITFFGLVLTGLPLVFAEQPWAKGLARFLGGVVNAGVWHRAFAIMLIINFVVHGIGLVHVARRRSGSWRSWLFGPHSLFPKWRDFRDCAGMFRWFFRGGRQPAFGRWTYWEKFDYWAEIGGSAIIGGSGLLLWFPETFARVFPGTVFNVAMIVHGYEALLALGFIFTIHFFNANLRPEKFPVDDVIFTGSLPEEELREERPDEYAELVASGELASRRVPASPSWHRPVAIVFGVTAMSIGIALVVLIVIGVISALRGS